MRASLIAVTAKAATEFASGSVASGVVPATIATLSETIIKGMFMDKITKAGIGLLVIVMLTIGFGGAAFLAPAAGNDTPVAAKTADPNVRAEKLYSENRLDGTWRVVAAELEGQDVILSLTDHPTITFTADKMLCSFKQLFVGHAEAAATGVHHVNFREFQIPFRVQANGLGIKTVQLYVSRDEGKTWGRKDEIEPDPTNLSARNSFTFRAPSDGTYWFGVISVLDSGVEQPGRLIDQVPLKVVVDTSIPLSKEALKKASEIMEFTYCLNTGVTPNRIDVFPTSEEHKGKKVQGICQLKGGELKLTLAQVPNYDRPKEFMSPKGSSTISLTLKKVEEPNPLWAGLSVSHPVLDQANDQFKLSFALLNDGTTEESNIDLLGSILDVNGKSHELQGGVVQEIDMKKLDRLKPGKLAQFSIGLSDATATKLFPKSGLYTLTWKGKGFASKPVELRVMLEEKSRILKYSAATMPTKLVLQVGQSASIATGVKVSDIEDATFHSADKHLKVTFNQSTGELLIVIKAEAKGKSTVSYEYTTINGKVGGQRALEVVVE